MRRQNTLQKSTAIIGSESCFPYLRTRLAVKLSTLKHRPASICLPEGPAQGSGARVRRNRDRAHARLGCTPTARATAAAADSLHPYETPGVTYTLLRISRSRSEPLHNTTASWRQGTAKNRGSTAPAHVGAPETLVEEQPTFAITAPHPAGFRVGDDGFVWAASWTRD